MLGLAALSSLVGASVWFAQSVFAPFVQDASVSYVLCTPSLTWLAADISIAAAVLGAACFTVERWWLPSKKSPQAPLRSVRLFAPLALVTINVASIGLLVPALRDWWPPIAYVTTTLRPIVWVVALSLVALNLAITGIDRPRLLLRKIAVRLGPAQTRLLVEILVATTAAAIVISTSPKIRFSAAPIGDEPKYLRYAENWWQGRGMDMDGIQDASATPAAAQGPRFFQNFANFPNAIRRDVSQLAADVDYLGNWKHWNHQFNKATYVGNWFVTGKNGGLYQMHQPGISFVIFPAYVLDRWLFDRGQGRFADDLFTVNLVMLLIWLGVGVATFRLIRLVVADASIAFVITVACLASVPLATFAFAFYPETLSALILSLVIHRLIAQERLSNWAALGIGTGIGWLVWLHVRFIVVAGVVFLWFVWTYRRDRRAAWLITLSCGTVTGAFCLYAYHVTGSILPSAFYDTGNPDAGFRFGRLPNGLLGVLFDRENGLLALAPMYLLALSGVGLLIRHSRRTALVILTVVLSLMITVAGHGYEASGTSPLRYMVAVTPLLAVAVARTLDAIRGRRLLVAMSLVLLLVSIHSAAAYNLFNDKTITQTIAAGISGWDTSFLFPLLRRTAVPGFDTRSLFFWEMAAMALVAAGLLSGARRAELTRPRVTHLTAIALCLLFIAVAGWAAFAAGGPRREPRLLETPQKALRACRLGCTGRAGSVQIGTIPLR